MYNSIKGIPIFNYCIVFKRTTPCWSDGVNVDCVGDWKQ